MRELIERLEQATGHDDALNYDIAVSQGWKPNRALIDGEWFTARWTTPSGETRIMCPWFTSSIDAALTLVPEGWAWSLYQGGCYATGKPLRPRAELAEPTETQFGPGVGIRTQVEAATPVLALCIAILKARQSLSGERAS